MHKIGNVLDEMSKSVQKKVRNGLYEIWMTETKEEAEQAFTPFCQKYQYKYPKAVECLTKDREVLFTFYDFLVEYCKYLRTTNQPGRVRS